MNQRDTDKMRRDRMKEKRRIAEAKLIPNKPLVKTIFVCPHCKEQVYQNQKKCRCEQTLDWSDK